MTSAEAEITNRSPAGRRQSGSNGAQRLATANADENHSEGLSEQNEAGEDITSGCLLQTPLTP
ncbi:hypothetical protein T02_3458 [Trichinella nativa]|uniref:Uncharacterized protein n=1 Tax=Trichinella nativa TaxID=6335 RepID=A0A0V1KJ78_9BILA|nr:hypothetical protein T02_3458 [Trichinella nativa]